jgi:hypothetical protein
MRCDPGNHNQPQSGSLGTGGVRSCFPVFAEAWSLVEHLQARTQFLAPCVCGRSNEYRSTACSTIRCPRIEEKIPQDLPDFIRIGVNVQRLRTKVELKLHVRSEILLGQGEHLTNIII